MKGDIPKQFATIGKKRNSVALKSVSSDVGSMSRRIKTAAGVCLYFVLIN